MRVLVIAATTLISIALLWIAKPVLVPLLLAALLAQLLVPMTMRLERRLPISVAALLSLGVTAMVVVGVCTLVASQLSLLATSLPAIVDRVSAALNQGSAEVGRVLGVAHQMQNSLLSKGLDSSLGGGGAAALTAVSFTIATLAEAALICILAYLMLYYRHHFRRQLKRLGERHGADSVGTAIDRVVELGQRYVAGLGIVMVIAGLSDTIGLLLIGAPFAAVFGFLGALAVLIPYVGFAVVAPTCAAISWLVTGSVGLAGGVILVFLCVHFIEGNLIAPILVGGKVSLNPLATIVAILVGGQMWGPAGMVLFIPLLGTLRLALDLWPSAEPLSRILGPVTVDDIRAQRSRAVARAIVSVGDAIKTKASQMSGHKPRPAAKES